MTKKHKLRADKACNCKSSAPTRLSENELWSSADDALRISAEQDDTVGNGIFDGPWDPPVQHAGNGVFEARYSEPGWLYRERLTRPAHGASADMMSPVVVPAGGGPPWQIDRAYRPWDDATPRPYDSLNKPLATPAPRSPVAMGSLGEDSEDDTASLAEWAIGGLVAGAGAYMLYAWLKGR